MSALLLCLVLTAVNEGGPRAADAGTFAPAETAPVPGLQDQLDQLQEQLAETQERLARVEARQSFLSKLSARFSGYFDFGFFAVQGNGSGVRKDLGHQGVPSLSNSVLGAWVLTGDPLSTAINSRGEPADIGDSRAIRFDAIHSGGHPGFLVNAVNLGLFATLYDDLTLTASVDFVPRDRDITDARGLFLGDFFDLKVAYVRYELEVRRIWLAFYAGKMDSVLGAEYRTQESPSRIGITPSLICRYTCGRPLGLKVKAGFFDRTLEVWLAVTNGSQQSDLFPFYNETDFNTFKTVSGRVQYRIPIGGRGLELSASGAIGAQDRQSDDSVLQWHYGFGAELELGDFSASAEFVTGRALGKPDTSGAAPLECGTAACLFYRGAYGQLAWRATSFLQPYARVDWRSATHRFGNEYVYFSDVLRATFGLRADVTGFLVLKAEYVVNTETARLSFPDDVFTTSLVVKY